MSISSSTSSAQLAESLPAASSDAEAQALSDAFEKLGAARWAFEVSNEGQVLDARWSPEIPRLIEYNDPSHFPTSLEFALSVVHPDDLPVIRASLAAAITDPAGKTAYDTVYRVKNAWGEYHWFRAVGRRSAEESAPGRHIFYGLLFRYDSIKAAQERLEARRRKLAEASESLRRQTEELENLRRREADDLASIRTLNAALEADRARLVRRMRVIDALACDCTSVWVVHMPALTITMHRNTGIFEDVPAADFAARTHDYAGSLRLYAEQTVHPEDRSRFLATLAIESVRRELARRPALEVVYRRLIRGKTDWFMMKLVLAAPGASEDIVVGFKSADKMVAAEEESRLKLESALKEAQQASEARTKFLNAVSHDIRTPMNAIVGMTAVASSHLKDPQRLESSLAKIASAGRELLALVNNVLDLSRLESGKLELAEDDVSLPAVFAAATDTSSAAAREKNVDFSVIIDCVLHEELVGDTPRLVQIVEHLAENAVKFTPAGGRVRLLLRETGCEDGRACFEFRCEDTGIGMSDTFQTRIFTPFLRSKVAVADGYAGSGLGLAIIKRLLALMQGDIDVQSRSGEGAVFTARFQLPVRAAPIPAPDVLTGRRVLIADDAAEDGRALMRTLESLGADAAQAASSRASETLSQATAESRPFDLMIARRFEPLLQASWANLVRILAASTLSEEDLDACRRAGITPLLAEPLFRSTLQKAILAAIEGRPATSRLRSGRVLVVDDNELNREIAMETLASLGLQSEAVASGREAIRCFEEHPGRWFDFILMDLEMPEMNGLEAVRALRRSTHSDAGSIPVVAMSASTRSEDRQAARLAGMSGWLEKPARRTDLAALASRLFSRGEAA